MTTKFERPDTLAVVGKTVLEQQLEASLWAAATLHTPVFTRDDLYRHVGPAHMQDDWYVKKVNGQTEVFLLCPCMTILVLARCFYVGHTGQCEEPGFPVEATLRRDTRCGRHMGTQKGQT